jgi:hypothetical protein
MIPVSRRQVIACPEEHSVSVHAPPAIAPSLEVWLLKETFILNDHERELTRYRLKQERCGIDGAWVFDVKMLFPRLVVAVDKWFEHHGLQAQRGLKDDFIEAAETWTFEHDLSLLVAEKLLQNPAEA